MTVSNCPNWHTSLVEKETVETLGEPDALKGARPVRRGIVGKGLDSVVQGQLSKVPRWRFTLPVSHSPPKPEGVDVCLRFLELLYNAFGEG